MGAPDRPFGLSPREANALELLARGHTVKSAAREMGASENAVAELLRSARGKLSAGSSREAARLWSDLGTQQKNGDELSGMDKPIGNDKERDSPFVGEHPPCPSSCSLLPSPSSRCRK